MSDKQNPATLDECFEAAELLQAKATQLDAEDFAAFEKRLAEPPKVLPRLREIMRGDTQAALDALDRLLNDALCYRDGYGTSRDDAKIVERALTAQPKQPDVNAEIDLDNAREVFENWLTGNGNYPHLQHKSFGGQYLHEEAAMKWDGFKAGYYARAEQKGHAEIYGLCPKCGSGDVKYCGISVRFHCGECKWWQPVNFGSKQDALNKLRAEQKAEV